MDNKKTPIMRRCSGISWVLAYENKRKMQKENDFLLFSKQFVCRSVKYAQQKHPRLFIKVDFFFIVHN